MSETIPRKPYLLRALCDWAEDNGWTPMVLVNAEHAGVQVPPSGVEDGKISLNISQRATRERDISAWGVRALARFSGEIFRLQLPLDSIEAFVVRESGEGMIFPPELKAEAQSTEAPDEPPPDAPPPPRGSHLKVVK
nr:ClpXP protease specificity-enhancing factor [Oceanococcus sp. HetDA_MAG_MS8]